MPVSVRAAIIPIYKPPLALSLSDLNITTILWLTSSLANVSECTESATHEETLQYNKYP